MLAGWTQHRASLRAKLDSIRPSGSTAIYDAVSAALPLFESRSHPRAALLIVSDGADTASDITIATLKQQLVRSDVLLYAIAIDSPNGRTSTRVNPYTLNELTSQGGGYAEVIASDSRARPGDRADRRRAESSIHDRLHTDDAGRRQVPCRFGSKSRARSTGCDRGGVLSDSSLEFS